VAWCATRRVSRPRLTFNTFPVKRRARGFFLARKATSVVHFPRSTENADEKAMGISKMYTVAHLEWRFPNFRTFGFALLEKEKRTKRVFFIRVGPARLEDARFETTHEDIVRSIV
jgi:hypothetical protein